MDIIEEFIKKCENGFIPSKNITYLNYFSYADFTIDIITDSERIIFYINLENYKILVRPSFYINENILYIKIKKENIRFLTFQTCYEQVFEIPKKLTSFFDINKTVMFDENKGDSIFELIDKYY